MEEGTWVCKRKSQTRTNYCKGITLMLPWEKGWRGEGGEGQITSTTIYENKTTKPTYSLIYGF